MNITLRKANTLQTAINDALKALDINTNVSVNEFQDYVQVIETARSALTANLGRRERLVAALFELRHKVGEANHVSGINKLLTDVAYHDKDLTFFLEMSKHKVQDDVAVIKGKLDKIRNSNSDRAGIYGYTNEVSTSIISGDELAHYQSNVAELRKAKQRMQDKILELNIKTDIELSDLTVQSLRDEKLL